MEAEREAIAGSSYSRAYTLNVVKLVGTKETTRIRVVLPRRIKARGDNASFKTPWPDDASSGYEDLRLAIRRGHSCREFPRVSAEIRAS